MPLKHLTETLLVVILGIVVVLTGILLSLLPPLPRGAVPWALVSAAMIAYPLGLYRLFREHRADYWFRVLHFAPLFLCLLWALLALVARRDPLFLSLYRGFVWGKSAAGVLLILFLVALFCLHVIRRRIPRLSALLLTALVFIGIVAMPARTWEDAVAWIGGSLSGSETTKDASGTLVAVQSSGKNLAPSSDPGEEAWRQKLRDAERKPGRDTATVGVKSTLSMQVSSTHSSVAPVIKKPGRLPSAGFDAEAMASVFVAGYAGVLHARAKRRVAIATRFYTRGTPHACAWARMSHWRRRSAASSGVGP